MSHLIVRENEWEANLRTLRVYPYCNNLYCLTRSRFVRESRHVRPFLIIQEANG